MSLHKTVYSTGNRPNMTETLLTQHKQKTKVIDVVPILQLRTSVIEIVTFKGGHLMWSK